MRHSGKIVSFIFSTAIVAGCAPVSLAESEAQLQASSSAQTDNFREAGRHNETQAGLRAESGADRQNRTAATFEARGPEDDGWIKLNYPQSMPLYRPGGWGSKSAIYPGAPNGISDGWGSGASEHITPWTTPKQASHAVSPQAPHVVIRNYAKFKELPRVEQVAHTRTTVKRQYAYRHTTEKPM